MASILLLGHPFDSVFDLSVTTQLDGRRSPSRPKVTPQVSAMDGKHVWVVPNPYRGYARIQDGRLVGPDAERLRPDGTHIDFLGMPRGLWTIKIFTVAGSGLGDSLDGSRERIDRPAVRQETPPSTRAARPRRSSTRDSTAAGQSNDGQASWNLISRNARDVVSGIYLFTVESSQGNAARSLRDHPAKVAMLEETET